MYMLPKNEVGFIKLLNIIIKCFVISFNNNPMERNEAKHCVPVVVVVVVVAGVVTACLDRYSGSGCLPKRISGMHLIGSHLPGWCERVCVEHVWKSIWTLCDLLCLSHVCALRSSSFQLLLLDDFYTTLQKANLLHTKILPLLSKSFHISWGITYK